jgi:hypothetical protein
MTLLEKRVLMGMFVPDTRGLIGNAKTREGSEQIVVELAL